MNIEKEPIIKVGILVYSFIYFELKGNFLLNSKPISSGKYRAILNNSRNIEFCKALENGDGSVSDVACNVPKKEQFEFIPLSPSSTFVLKNVTIGIGFHWEREEDQEFEGGLTLQVEGNKIRAINSVLLESYLKSVISSEMSAMNDLNLLNTHAIVSRSWLLAQLQNKGAQKQISLTKTETEIVKWYDREDHEIFDVCADDHCQRYQGITKVISENAQKAIDATRGLVLIFGDEICDARFSKCCGGITESFENVWQQVKVPYLVAVHDIIPKPDRFEDETFFITSPKAFCNTSDSDVLSQVLIDFDRTTTNFYRWSVQYSQQELSELIARKSGINFGEIIDLIPLERSNSGRLIRMKIIGTKKELIVGKELEIRKWLSESHLYSSAFIVEKVFSGGNEIPSGFIIRGAGWGHGVGMCQIGAAVMSRKGYTPNQILEHYFSGATIKSIY